MKQLSLALFALVLVTSPSIFQPQAALWRSTASISMGTNTVTALRHDPDRPFVYALDRENHQVLFISLEEFRVAHRLYVGKRPSSLDIDATGRFLYVGNEGVGTGLPGSFQIAEIDLENQAKLRHFTVSAGLIHNSPLRAENVTCGREGIVYFNSGYHVWNSGYAGAIDTTTGEDEGGMPAIKSPMVISSDKNTLYGQYIYTGNLGEMGAFDVTLPTAVAVDSFRYSPYPYGWDYDNYSLSADDQKLVLGYVLFNAKTLADQLGLFPEMIYALNYDGSVAFGSAAIWDTSSFSINGDATRLQDQPVQSKIMRYDPARGVLWAANLTGTSIHSIEPCSQGGIPFRWLRKFGLETANIIETMDTDADGYTLWQEWALDEDPGKPTVPYRLEVTGPSRFTMQTHSRERMYRLESWDGSTPVVWTLLQEARGNGGQIHFTPSEAPVGLYRVSVYPIN